MKIKSNFLCKIPDSILQKTKLEDIVLVYKQDEKAKVMSKEDRIKLIDKTIVVSMIPIKNIVGLNKNICSSFSAWTEEDSQYQIIYLHEFVKNLIDGIPQYILPMFSLENIIYASENIGKVLLKQRDMFIDSVLIKNTIELGKSYCEEFFKYILPNYDGELSQESVEKIRRAALYMSVGHIYLECDDSIFKSSITDMIKESYNLCGRKYDIWNIKNILLNLSTEVSNSEEILQEKQSQLTMSFVENCAFLNSWVEFCEKRHYGLINLSNYAFN